MVRRVCIGISPVGRKAVFFMCLNPDTAADIVQHTLVDNDVTQKGWGVLKRALSVTSAIRFALPSRGKARLLPPIQFSLKNLDRCFNDLGFLAVIYLVSGEQIV